MLGHICLAVPSLTTFYLGLGLIALGTGLLKPNISTMVGKLYTPEDERRDAGFSIYYMGINTGAFIAPLVSGWLAQSEHVQRILASVGIAPENVLALGFRRWRRSACSSAWCSTSLGGSISRPTGCIPSGRPIRRPRRRWTAQVRRVGIVTRWPWSLVVVVLVLSGAGGARSGSDLARTSSGF